MNYYLKYILLLILLTIIGILYERYKKKVERTQMMDDNDLIKKYLLQQSDLANSKKPIMWIHVNFEKNARWWSSFGSRNTYCLNQPYMLLTIKSIIEHCGDSFQIVLIDDETFNKIIPGWTTKIYNLPSPLNDHLRKLALMKLLNLYGGMLVPPSFICKKNLYSLYNRTMLLNDIFVGETVSSSKVSSMATFFPDTRIMASTKNNEVLTAYINYLEKLVSNDYTNDIEFNDETNKWIYREILNKKILVVDGKYFGVKTKENEPVLIDDLMGDYDIEFMKGRYGVFIPSDDLLKRTHYNWFCRLSPEQALEANTQISKLIIQSNK
jgi:hypothetical protein